MTKLQTLEDEIKEEFEDVVVYDFMKEIKRKVPVVSSGLLGVDRILRIDGFPKGRITELYGMESTGKSTLALQLVAEVQKQTGLLAIYFDAEYGLKPEYVIRLGVDKEKFLVAQADTGEEIFGIILKKLIPRNDIGIIVIDSLAGVIPLKEWEEELDKDQYAAKARMMAKALRHMMKPLGRTDIILIIINQLIDNIGGYGKVTPGGKALRFYASIRLSLELDSKIKIGQNEGTGVKFHVQKNKLGIPHFECTQFLRFDHGFDKVYDVFSEMMMLGLAKRKGSWVTLCDDQKFQGFAALRRHLAKNPDEANVLVKKVNEEWQKRRNGTL